MEAQICQDLVTHVGKLAKFFTSQMAQGASGLSYPIYIYPLHQSLYVLYIYPLYHSLYISYIYPLYHSLYISYIYPLYHSLYVLYIYNNNNNIII